MYVLDDGWHGAGLNSNDVDDSCGRIPGVLSFI